MSDAEPKRIAREPGCSALSPGEPMPAGTAPDVPAAIGRGAIVPEAPTAPEVVSAAPEAAAQPAAQTRSATADPPADSANDSGSANDPWTAVAEAQAAPIRGFEAITVAMTGMTRSSIAAAGDAAIGLFGAMTFSEAVEINAGLALLGVDAMIEGSANLSDIGVTAVSEASRPMPGRHRETRSSAHCPIIS